MAILFPSLISGDILNLRHQLEQLDPYCQGYHLDVMDGHFVPNITWGPAFINEIAKTTRKQLWVHLMATNPGKWIDQLTIPSESMVDFHIETHIDHADVIRQIIKKGWHAGIALKPQTPLDAVTPLLEDLDYVLIMSVEPGFSGQRYIASSTEKIKDLAAYRQTHNLAFDIAVDGGINHMTIEDVLRNGADAIAIASAIFSQHDPIKALESLQKTAETYEKNDK